MNASCDGSCLLRKWNVWPSCSSFTGAAGALDDPREGHCEVKSARSSGTGGELACVCAGVRERLRALDIGTACAPCVCGILRNALGPGTILKTPSLTLYYTTQCSTAQVAEPER